MKFTILQLRHLNHNSYMFMSYDFAIKHGFSLDDYVEVYKSELETFDEDNLDYCLESIFTKFNIDRPIDFEGHSLSVSDLIKLEDGRIFYVDSCGYVEVTQ